MTVTAGPCPVPLPMAAHPILSSESYQSSRGLAQCASEAAEQDAGPDSRRTVFSIVHQHAEGVQRNAIALEVWDENDGVTMTVSFAQLSAGVHSAAMFLQEVGGLVRGDYCALHSHNTVAYVCASLGAMELGASSVNLSWRQPDSVNLGLLASLHVRILLHSQDFSSLAELAAHDAHCEGMRVMLFESICATPLHTVFPFAPVQSVASLQVPAGLATATPAAVFFTGGTTGTPKAVPHTHETLLSMVDGYLRQHGSPLDPSVVGERAGSVCFTPYFHVMGYVCCLVVNLVAGCRSAVLASADTKLSAPLMLAACRGLRPTVCHTVPVVVEGLVRMIRAGDDKAAAELAKLHLFTYGGAALPEEHARALAQKGVTLQCAYGQTELCGPVCYGQQGSVHPLYRPLDGIGYELVREEGDGPDEGSLVLLGATSATYGYLNSNADLPGGGAGPTHERYLTGDRFARERVAGQPGEWLRYLSRKDDILTHSSGEMTNPLITEQSVLDEAGAWLSHGGVVVCGTSLPRPVLVLEPVVFEMPSKQKDEAMRTALRAAIRSANALQPTYSAVLMQNVWLVPAASLPRTVKGTIQRKPVEAMLKTGAPPLLTPSHCILAVSPVSPLSPQPMPPPFVHSGALPKGATKLEDEEAAAEFDSMSLTINAQATKESLITMHMCAITYQQITASSSHSHTCPHLCIRRYAIAMTSVVYTHFYTQVLPGSGDDAVLNADLIDVASQLNMDHLPIFSVFCVLAGVNDLNQNWPWRSVLRQTSIHVACACLMIFTHLPLGVILLHNHLWDMEALLVGEYKQPTRRVAFPGGIGLEYPPESGFVDFFSGGPIAIRVVWWSFALRRVAVCLLSSSPPLLPSHSTTRTPTPISLVTSHSTRTPTHLSFPLILHPQSSLCTSSVVGSCLDYSPRSSTFPSKQPTLHRRAFPLSPPSSNLMSQPRDALPLTSIPSVSDVHADGFYQRWHALCTS